ncbi:MAG: amidase domain-containing protein [Massilimicrobiota timonensis]
MKKIITMILSGIMIFTITFGNVSATNTFVQYQANTTENPYLQLDSIIPVVNEKRIELKGTINPLYWEFDDFNKAVTILKSYNQDKFNLSDLTVHNWEIYAEEFDKKYTPEQITEDKQLTILSQFFTVCKNQYMNKEILSLYNKKDYQFDELVVLLPYTSPIIEKIMNSKANLRMTTTSISTRDRRIMQQNRYARKYGDKPNIKKYNFYSGNDCTNFVSQVLAAGGIKTNSTWKPYTRTWIKAHAFVLYWYMKTGAKNGYPNFASISKTLKAGDIIGADWGGDGHYDHCAYVVADGPKTSAGYYDITIAQHSKEYVSKASKTNWKDLKKGLYVRLRI